MVQKNKDKPLSKRYIAIAKTGNNPDGSARCVKYRFDNILKFRDFLDVKHPTWRWFNVYSNRGMNKGEQLASFTKYNLPTKKYV